MECGFRGLEVPRDLGPVLAFSLELVGNPELPDDLIRGYSFFSSR